MNHSGSQHRHAKSRKLIENVSARLRVLADAGASGQHLTPREVREICEALRMQEARAQTRFHSGFG